jgi:hypothetical protein
VATSSKQIASRLYVSFYSTRRQVANHSEKMKREIEEPVSGQSNPSRRLSRCGGALCGAKEEQGICLQLVEVMTCEQNVLHFPPTRPREVSSSLSRLMQHYGNQLSDKSDCTVTDYFDETKDFITVFTKF